MLALEITGLSKTYQTGLQALKGIDLHVEQGDFFALLGPNGAGKSTTIGIITSLVTKTDGNVKIFGIDTSLHPQQAKAQIGLVPQELNFSQFEAPLEIVVNQAGFYGIPRKLALQRAEIYLKQLGLWEKRDQPSRSLSGGMKRRLMIARALVHEPRLLILDEPTAGVDIELRRTMWDFLRDINDQGTTIILTTHYLEEAESMCRNIAIINQGNIIENCPMRDLLNRLNMETLILELTEPLKTAPVNNPFETRLIDEHCLEVTIQREQRLNDLFAFLTNHNIQVSSMRNKSNRLEEMFIKLLGDKS